MNSTPVMLAGIFVGVGVLSSLMHPTMPWWFGALGGLGLAIFFFLIGLTVMLIDHLWARRRG